MAFQPAPLPSIGHLMDVSTSNASGAFFLLGPENNNVTQLRIGRRLTAAYGSYSLTGQDATLTKSATDYLAPAPIPSIGILLGTDSSSARRLPAVTGMFSVQGQDVTFRKGRALVAEVAVFSASGAPAERDIELDPLTASFVLTGQDATLRRGYTLTALGGPDGTGSYFAFLGQQAGLAKESTADRVLSATTGIFTLTTHADNWTGTGMRATRIMYADYGTFTLTGQSVDFDAPVWHTVVRTDDVWVQVSGQSSTWTNV